MRFEQGAQGPATQPGRRGEVLPREALTSDERRSRFEREAQVLAALNNPNIAQVFKRRRR